VGFSITNRAKVAGFREKGILFRKSAYYLLGSFPLSLANVGLSPYFCALLTNTVMGVTRLKRKNRKDKSKSKVRRTTLKNNNFQPVAKSVDIEKIKEEFKTKASAKA
jgi:hypothetical protein